MEGHFSLFEQKEATNKELVINYKPSASIVKYTYKVYNNNTLISNVTVDSNKTSTIHLVGSGTYKIEVTLIDKANNTLKEASGIYNIDMDKPVMAVNDNIFIMERLASDEDITMSDLKGTLKVIDKQDGDLFDKTKCNLDEIDFSKIGLYDLKCSVQDSAGNETINTFKFNITSSSKHTLGFMQGLVFIILIILILLIIRYRKAIKLEKRIAKYSTMPVKDNRISSNERLKNNLRNIISRMNKTLKKSVFITRYAEKYNKYIPLFNDIYKDGIDFVSFKFILAFIFIIITLFSKTINFKVLSLEELILPFCLGFFLPDIIYFIRYKLYRNQLENDLLQAIIVMNNAFKSGRSIIQAIELVTTELKGPISEEFKKMRLELTFGLSVDVVFKRFSERIKLDEVTYLTASLSILNRTGGNIIKVFSSIEKTLFNKKKLKLEMASLTGASKIIIVILFMIPILFILIISLVSPCFFEPFYTTTLGFILMVIIIFIYLIYIWAINKIMKVRM